MEEDVNFAEYVAGVSEQFADYEGGLELDMPQTDQVFEVDSAAHPPANRQSAEQRYPPQGEQSHYRAGALLFEERRALIEVIRPGARACIR